MNSCISIIYTTFVEKFATKRGNSFTFSGSKNGRNKRNFPQNTPFFPIASTLGCHNMTSLQSLYPIPSTLDPYKP